MDRAELEKLSSVELHDRAMALARRRLDVGILWRLIEAIPAAQAAAGNLDEAEADILSLSSLINDFMETDEAGELADALRPFYIDYLLEHSD